MSQLIIDSTMAFAILLMLIALVVQGGWIKLLTQKQDNMQRDQRFESSYVSELREIVQSRKATAK